MNYKYTNVDNIFYESYEKMINTLNQFEQNNIKAYIYFFENTPKSKIKENINNMQKFINSNKIHYFLNGPEDFL